MKNLPARIACCLALGVLLVAAGCTRTDPAAMIDSAKSYLAKSDYKAAAIQLKNALQKAPDNAEARYLFARTLLASGDAAGAETELSKAQELKYSDDAVYPLLAQAVLAQGKAQRVTAELASHHLADPKARADLATTVAAAQLRLGNLEGARKAIDEAVKDAADVPRTLLVEAQIDAAGNDLTGAMAKVDAALAKAPDEIDAIIFKTQLLGAQGKRDEAIKLLESAVEDHPGAVSLRFTLVTLLATTQKLDEAKSHVAYLREHAPNDLRTQYADALWSYAKGDAAHARDALQRVLSASPDHLPSLMLSGLVQYQLGSYALAEDALRRVLAKVPNEPTARRALAATYLRTRRPAEALEMINPLIKADVADPGAWRVAGEAALATGNMTLASTYYEHAAGLDKGNVGTQVRLAQVRMASGETARAFSDLESISAADPSQAQADMALIAGHLRRHEYDKALAASDALIRKQPENPLTYSVRGSIYLAKRDLANARTSFDKALSLDPKNFPAAYNLAMLDVREGKPQAAKARYESMLDKEPGNEQLLIAEADLLALTGNPPADTRKLIDKAVVANPSSVRARLALVTFHERQHDFKAAQEAAQSALSAIPNDPQVLGALAGAQLAGGNIGQAVETYRRLAASQPQSAAAQLRLAEAEAANKDLSAAIVATRKALALQPSDAKGWLLLAKLMIASGHPDDAIAEARKLQKDRPKDGIGFALEGEIRAAQRNWGDAAVAYRKAYAQSPTPLVAARSYSVLINANQPGEAKALADKWNREHPKDVTLRVMSAQASQARNDAPAAIAQYRAALDIEPDNVVVLNNLAWLLSQAQDPQALDIAERAYRLAPFNPNVMDTLGWTLVNTGDVTRGTQLLRMASNLSPGNSDIRLHLGKALAKAGDKAGARAQLEPLTRLKAGSPVQAEAEKALSTF